jgi:urease accessory protein
MLRALYILLAVALLPFAADAHTITEDSGFMAGLQHPVLGLDHFLAMLSVGIVSTQIGKRAIWTVPATFVVMMSVGGVLGFIQFDLPSTEYILSFSVFALGLAIAIPRKMPVLLAMVFVGGVWHVPRLCPRA